MVQRRSSGAGFTLPGGVPALAALVVAALSAVTWYGWLGWDQEYQTDPVTGISSGPYETWQVVGCVLTLLALAVGSALLLHPKMPFVVAVAFTAAWVVWAATGGDDSGLWLVGAIMVLIGTVGAAAIVTGVIDAIGRRSGHRVG